MVRSGARISILISFTSPELSASILSGLNSTVHLSLGFLLRKDRLRMGAVPAFPTRKSTGVFLPAVRDVLRVPAAEPILRSWVPLRLILRGAPAEKPAARADRHRTLRRFVSGRSVYFDAQGLGSVF